MGGKNSHEEQQPNAPNAMNYLNSAQYQAMYNQIYSGATTNPLQGERFEHRDFQYDGVRNESSQPIPIEVKKTVAVKLEMSIDKKSIELRRKEGKNWMLRFKFSCDVEIMITNYFFAFEVANQQTGITESITSVHEKNVMTYKFPPSKNADFPEDKSVICLTEEKMRELSAVAPSQFPLIIKMEKSSPYPQDKKLIYVYCKFLKESGEKFSVQVIRQKYEMNGVATIADEVFGIGTSKLTEATNKEAADCIICMTDKIDVIVLPCNHMCLCYTCCVDFRSKNKKCPICRTAIESFVKMEMAGQNPQNYQPNTTNQQQPLYNPYQQK